MASKKIYKNIGGRLALLTSKIIKTTHPYVGTQSNSKNVCLFQFYFSNNIAGNLVKYFVHVAHGAIKFYRQKNQKLEVADARKS